MSPASSPWGNRSVIMLLALRRSFWAALLCVLVGTPGCNVYLHNDSFDTQASQARKDFGKIDVSAVFKQQQARLTALETKEDQAVTAFNVYRRDSVAIDIIRPPPQSSSSTPLGRPLQDSQLASPDANLCASKLKAKARLDCVLRQDLDAIVGNTSITDDDLLTIASLPETIRIDLDSTAAAARAAFSVTRDAYIKERRPSDDKWPTDCASILKKGRVDGSDRLSQLRERMFEQCSGMPVADPIKDIRVGGRLGDAVQEYRAALINRQQQLAESENLQAQLKALGIPEAPVPIAGDVTSGIATAREALNKAQGIAAKIGWTQVSCAIDDLLTKELMPPSTATSPAPPSGSPPAPALPSTASAHSACKTTAPNLTTPTSSASPSTKAADDQKGATVLQLALPVTDTIDTYRKQTTLEHVNSLLVAKAQVTHQLNIAAVQADYTEDQIRLASAKALSLARQLRHVKRAMSFTKAIPDGANFDEIVASGKPGALDATGMALSEWAASQNEGYVVWRVLDMKEYQLERAYTVKLAATTNEDFKNLLQPVFNDLEAYGKGGIPPEALARVLADLGLLSALVAK